MFEKNSQIKRLSFGASQPLNQP